MIKIFLLCIFVSLTSLADESDLDLLSLKRAAAESQTSYDEIQKNQRAVESIAFAAGGLKYKSKSDTVRVLLRLEDYPVITEGYRKACEILKTDVTPSVDRREFLKIKSRIRYPQIYTFYSAIRGVMNSSKFLDDEEKSKLKSLVILKAGQIILSSSNVFELATAGLILQNAVTNKIIALDEKGLGHLVAATNKFRDLNGELNKMNPSTFQVGKEDEANDKMIDGLSEADLTKIFDAEKVKVTKFPPAQMELNSVYLEIKKQNPS